jgi:hypothetical protein
LVKGGEATIGLGIKEQPAATNLIFLLKILIQKEER